MSYSKQKLSKMSQKFVLIDSDAGTDDAWGLFMALAANRDILNFRIVGITTSCGNSDVTNVSNNVTRTLDTVNDTTTPIFQGMDSYILNPFSFLEDPPYNGEDGFGDADLPPIPTRIQSENAVNAIIRLAELYQGQLTFVCFGPLTNLAMAVKFQPQIRNWIKEIYILGGNIEGVGNVTGVSSSAEFNFYVDPEAVQIVFDSFEIPIYDLPWEVMLKSANSTYEFRMETLGNMGTPIIDLLNTIEAKNLSENTTDWLAPDPILMACVIDPNNVIREMVEYRCDVELKGSLTRGMMVLDRNPNSEKPKNVNVIMDINLQLYQDMLIWAAGGPRP